MITSERFQTIFEEYIDDITSFLYMYASDKAELKDLVQEVFIKIWSARDKIDPDHPSFKGYLLKTARNHALKKLRREKRYSIWLEEYLEQLTSVGFDEKFIDSDIWIKSENNENDDNNLVQAYRSALEKIPPGALKIYMLSREDGLTYPEIADMLNISIKTVETQISRALKILRKELFKFRDRKI